MMTMRALTALIMLLVMVLASVSCSDGEEQTPAPPAPPARPESDHSCPTFDWPRCDSIQPGLSLAELAARFDQVARDEHLAGDQLLRNLRRSDDLQQIEHWQQHPNVILWSGMYLASQALRYRVTGEAEALDNAKVVVAGLRSLTGVTGIDGLYGRTLAKPGVAYDSDGDGLPHWVESTAPGYAGWRWHDDVSKDGYDGLMFGYAAALEHFDDAELLAEVRELAAAVGYHLVGNGLQIIDHTGEVTEHGRLYHTALDDFPGFNAVLAASWVKIAAGATAQPALDDFYYGCLMGVREGVACPAVEAFNFGTYIESIETMMGLFLSDCQQNYDNFDMVYQALYPLVRRERDDELRRRLIAAAQSSMFHSDDPAHQSIAEIGNAMFTFAYAASTCDGPEDDPLLAQAMNAAVCTLKQFPPEKIDRFIPAGTQPEVCRNRLDVPCAAEPIPLPEYHFDNYLWRLDFFEIQQERPEDARQVYSPEDFLVAYWLGRYHGFIDPEL